MGVRMRAGRERWQHTLVTLPLLTEGRSPHCLLLFQLLLCLLQLGAVVRVDDG